MTGIKEAVVETRARLHLGFLDMNFSLGRRFGSLGLALERPRTRVRASRSPLPDGVNCERAREIARGLDSGGGIHVAVEEAIPAHAGLGSGTQLALAVGGAIEAARGRELDARRLSPLLDRGARSGIGLGVFEQGGFLVDGGRSESARPAPIVARLPFPEVWRVLLVFDDALSGTHGAAERAAFAAMPPVSDEFTGHICRLTLLKILPALAEGDLQVFSEGVRAIQDGMGALFAPWQGDGPCRSERVREILAWFDARGINGSGQSSWGPTGFAFTTQARGEKLLDEVRSRFAGEAGLRFDLVRGINHGASVTTS